MCILFDYGFVSLWRNATVKQTVEKVVKGRIWTRHHPCPRVMHRRERG
jgi:hypothetical protein